MADSREKALQDYRKKLLEHKEVDGRLKECTAIVYAFQGCERNVCLFVGKRAEVAVKLSLLCHAASIILYIP